MLDGGGTACAWDKEVLEVACAEEVLWDATAAPLELEVYNENEGELASKHTGGADNLIGEARLDRVMRFWADETAPRAFSLPLSRPGKGEQGVLHFELVLDSRADDAPTRTQAQRRREGKALKEKTMRALHETAHSVRELVRAAQRAHERDTRDVGLAKHFKLMRREHERALARVREADRRPDESYMKSADAAASAKAKVGTRVILTGGAARAAARRARGRARRAARARGERRWSEVVDEGLKEDAVAVQFDLTTQYGLAVLVGPR